MEKGKDIEKRKLQREYDNKLTYHHIINKISRDLFINLDDSDNLKSKKRGPHRKRHHAHENEHPLETLQNIQRFKQVMSERAIEAFDTLISMSKEEFYKDKFLKKAL